MSRGEEGETTVASIRVRGKETIYKTELEHSVKMGILQVCSWYQMLAYRRSTN